jgi:hypothetical protein
LHAAQNVLDYLAANRDAELSPADILERFGQEASPGSALHSALAASEKLQQLPSGSFIYKVSVSALKLRNSDKCSLHGMGAIRSSPTSSSCAAIQQP